MTLDTVFDLASLTKPIATATSIMILIQQDELTSKHPLRSICQTSQQTERCHHRPPSSDPYCGLIADNSIDDYKGTPEEAFAKIDALTPKAAPDEEFTYSDVGFIVLGRIVQAVSGKNVHEFARENVYQPLAMNETGYLPADPLKARAA